MALVIDSKIYGMSKELFIFDFFVDPGPSAVWADGDYTPLRVCADRNCAEIIEFRNHLVFFPEENDHHDRQNLADGHI